MGFTLIEFMIAITLGLLVVFALVLLYVNLSRTNTEMAKTNRLIENGRFAIQVLQSDVAHAGFWAELVVPTPTAIPDPCAAVPTDAALKKTYFDNMLGVPVQGYADGSTLSGCGVTGVLGSSDVLVVRHANTCSGGTDTGPYLQLSSCSSDPKPYIVDSGTTTFTLLTKACTSTTTAVLDACSGGATTTTVAPLRKFVSDIYYLASSGGVPTLMRVSYVNGAYTTPQPLIDGIEAFHAECGIDVNGSNGLPISSSNPGDGNADTFVACNAMTLTQMANVMAVKLYVLARNTETTGGYTDSKTYALGSVSIAGSSLSAGYKRHVFSTTVRLVNPSSNRETP